MKRLKIPYVPEKEKKRTLLNEKVLLLVNSNAFGRAGVRAGYPYCYCGSAQLSNSNSTFFIIHWYDDHEWKAKTGFLTEAETEMFTEGDLSEDTFDSRFKYLDTVLSQAKSYCNKDAEKETS